MTCKLKPEVKRNFLAALRSGAYQQGHGGLYIQDKRGDQHHCCLGVLTDLAVKDGIVEWSKRNYFGGHQFGVFKDGDFEGSLLPFDVAVWALEDMDKEKYDESEGDLRFGKGWRETLMALNDIQHKDFHYIAEIIEEYL